jgi:hypothetical protein
MLIGCRFGEGEREVLDLACYIYYLLDLSDSLIERIEVTKLGVTIPSGRSRVFLQYQVSVCLPRELMAGGLNQTLTVQFGPGGYYRWFGERPDEQNAFYQLSPEEDLTTAWGKQRNILGEVVREWNEQLLRVTVEQFGSTVAWRVMTVLKRQAPAAAPA